MSNVGSALSGAGSLLGGVGNIIGAVQKPDSPEVVKPNPFKKPLSTGSYWFGGGQLRSSTGDVLGQERSLRERLGGLAQTVAPGFANDQMAQLDAEFRMQEAMAVSQTYQQEFSATLQTIQAETLLKEQQAAREIAELGIATDFLAEVNQVTSKQSKALAELAGEQALRAAGLDPDSLDLPPSEPTQTATSAPNTSMMGRDSDRLFWRR
jgi:hypothetical protein